MKTWNKLYDLLEEEGVWTSNYDMAAVGTQEFVYVWNTIIGEETEFLRSQYFNDLWTAYIVPYYRNWYVKGDVIDFLKRFIAKAVQVSNRYMTILGYYDAAKDKLLDGISTTTVSRFNDTPQSAGDYSTTPYTSNVSTSSSTYDGTSKMSRLNEIQQGIVDVYRVWSMEFASIFMPPQFGDGDEDEN